MRINRLLKAGTKYIKSADYRFLIHTGLGIYDYLSDEEYVKRKYRACFGRKLNLENPQTYNEKLQWLKLYDRKPEYTRMVDKYRVREYIAQTIGEEYLIPLLGVWEDPEDIDFDALPDQFVLKCNHNSGLGMCICKDKSKLDIKKAKRELKKGLKQDYYLTGREWPYKDVPRRIIAEKYMVDESGTELKDFKVLCFAGKAKMIQVHKCWNFLKTDPRFKRAMADLVLVMTDGGLTQYRRDPRTMKNLCWVILDNPSFNVQYPDARTKCIYINPKDIN